MRRHTRYIQILVRSLSSTCRSEISVIFAVIVYVLQQFSRLPPSFTAADSREGRRIYHESSFSPTLPVTYSYNLHAEL